MGNAIFLTGPPGCGKTTVIRNVLARLERKANGFITQEIREGGTRKGFKITTLDGDEGILAHIDLKSSPHIGKYGVDLEALEALGVRSLRRALERGTLAVVDEIGPMEILSKSFRRVLSELLDGDSEILGTIVKRSLPFTDAIKARSSVEVLEIHPGNREWMVSHLLALLVQ
jgi:nucleoside-triphosphatase